MTPLAVFLPLLASVMGLPILDTPSPTDLVPIIQGFASQFDSDTTLILSSIDNAVIDIARAAYITLILLGILLYFTRVSRRLGKDLLTGGVILFVLAEFLIPMVMTL